MFSTPHATTAIVLSAVVPNPVAAFLLGVVSHLVLDAIPHGDRRFFSSTLDADGVPQFTPEQIRKFNLVGSIELVAALVLVILITQKITPEWPVIAAAVFGGLLPDLLIPASRLPFLPASWDRAYRIFNHRVHTLLFKKDLPWPVGFTLQAGYTVVILLLIFWIHK